MSAETKLMKLCIDPGHGMGNRNPGTYDPGAVSSGVAEADIALAWALTIKHVFREAGIEVFLTRDDASDITPVGKRDDRAKAAGCTHFLSLHCNAGTVAATGTETFYRDDMAWARSVNDLAVGVMLLKNRGVKHESQTQHDRLAVMDFPGKACLLEIGFITHPTDRARMLMRDNRVKFAKGLLNLWKGLGG